MRLTPTSLHGMFVVDLEPRGDERGFFARAWCREVFAEHGLAASFVQANVGYSARRGTVRGLHYQLPPHAEAKYLRCCRGAVFDVAVDLRPDSPSYLQWAGVELSAENRRLVYVPEGCAHGYQAVEDDTEVFYFTSAAYAPQAERGIRWDDPRFAIEWPHVGDAIVSDKDRAWPDFAGPAAAEEARVA